MYLFSRVWILKARTFVKHNIFLSSKSYHTWCTGWLPQNLSSVLLMGHVELFKHSKWIILWVMRVSDCCLPGDQLEWIMATVGTFVSLMVFLSILCLGRFLIHSLYGHCIKKAMCRPFPVWSSVFQYTNDS